MPGMLYQVMKKEYGAYPLMLAVGDIAPGLLLETIWEWDPFRYGLFESYPRFRGQEGYAWEVLGIDPGPYQHEVQEASIIAGEITEKIEFGAGFPLPQFGLSIKTSLKETRVARLTIGSVKGARFKRGVAANELLDGLRKLRAKNPARWKWVENDFFVTESYYTANLRLEFKENGGANAKAELQKAGLKAEGDFTVKWENNYTLALNGTAAVPFAVQGRRVL